VDRRVGGTPLSILHMHLRAAANRSSPLPGIPNRIHVSERSKSCCPAFGVAANPFSNCRLPQGTSMLGLIQIKSLQVAGKVRYAFFASAVRLSCAPGMLFAGGPKKYKSPEQAAQDLNKDVCISSHIYDCVVFDDVALFLDLCRAEARDARCSCELDRGFRRGGGS
jgi:hypothetical protein